MKSINTSLAGVLALSIMVPFAASANTPVDKKFEVQAADTTIVSLVCTKSNGAMTKRIGLHNGAAWVEVPMGQIGNAAFQMPVGIANCSGNSSRIEFSVSDPLGRYTDQYVLGIKPGGIDLTILLNGDSSDVRNYTCQLQGIKASQISCPSN